jgi:imidazolonepropionase-like amidohydrolase
VAKKHHYEIAKAAVRALHAAGVTILAGTDAPNPDTSYGVSLHQELLLLTECGLSPEEALRAATSGPAREFGLIDRGRIESGRRADLLLVKGDPTNDVRATRAIVGVFGKLEFRLIVLRWPRWQRKAGRARRPPTRISINVENERINR